MVSRILVKYCYLESIQHILHDKGTSLGKHNPKNSLTLSFKHNIPSITDSGMRQYLFRQSGTYRSYTEYKTIHTIHRKFPNHISVDSKLAHIDSETTNIPNRLGVTYIEKQLMRKNCRLKVNSEERGKEMTLARTH